jgi:hypothetical protein
MAIEDKRLDYLRKQLDAHGLFCTRKMDGDPDSCRFSISHDPEIELVLNKELLATSSWLFTQRADEAVCTLSDARRNSRWGTLTMRFLDVAWHPKLDFH